MVYREFIGQAQREAFFEAAQSIPGGGISPGGAAILLGLTRQRISALIYQHPHIRAWVYRERPGNQALYVEISVRDLLRYGVVNGKFQVGDQLPYIGELTSDKLDAIDDVHAVA